MNDVLHNPVYHALFSLDAHLGSGNEQVRFFDEAVSPFAGFAEDYDRGFEALFHLLHGGRKILYVTPGFITEPEGWMLRHEVEGLQFLYESNEGFDEPSLDLVPLDKSHVEEMVELATLTKPGPFGLRTIEFGHYHGIFGNGRLVAMTGQRLHVKGFTEISAVCTHPDYLGRGYAAALMKHQINLIRQQGQTPFLHVRADNERAIALYERLGFKKNRSMNFYFLQRRNVC